MKQSLEKLVSNFGASAKAKLSNPGAVGASEDQLRGPFDQLIKDLAEHLDFSSSAVVAVGETSLAELKTRPDYSITVHGNLIGFVELKAPGKGANPKKFKGTHDKAQWERLRLLPNLIYSDGNEFSLWQDGLLIGSVVRLLGDIESSGSKLAPDAGFLSLFQNFLLWKPIPPNTAKELAHISARLCRLLRDEVTEQLELKSEAFTGLANDWRVLLFPEATNERFADGYAQAVTFGLLMARAKHIQLSNGLNHVAQELGKSSSLIGAALRLLTDNAENQLTLKTSIGTLTRVLDVVDWNKISKGKSEAWLYFYEDFLEVYDQALRKLTGSYYTPPEVVASMVRLVDEVLKSSRYGQHAGLASPTVTLADPATGTGTFLLGVLQRIASTVTADEGPGAVKGAIESAVSRLIGFEIQLGPFAVAQLRILAEIVALTGSPPKATVRMFVTDALGNPDDDQGWIPNLLEPIAKSRKDANKIKRDEVITVVIGNPPYKEKAKRRGGWVEGESTADEKTAPLAEWMPPPSWGVGTHGKHLRNLYIYFWRWATWKVFDQSATNNTGVVCFITVAGFLGGPGFEKMRDYLRRKCDDIWIIDCSPEGHQPGVSTRIFQGVQQPVCIVLASRSSNSDLETPAHVRFQALPEGHRDGKFGALVKLTLKSDDWIQCPTDWRAPFRPASTGAWAEYPILEDYFLDNSSGVMPGRTWIISPDSESLVKRWRKLVTAPADQKESLFHPHMRRGMLGDRHSKRSFKHGLSGVEMRSMSVSEDTNDCIQPVRYAFRSFDRQWIIPDNRLINSPNPELWQARSDKQLYLTALSRTAPSSGPALTVTGLIADLDHYNGRGGRVFSLWQDKDAQCPNIRPKLLEFLANKYEIKVTAEDVFGYIVAVSSHPAYILRFHDDFSTPGLRIPLTASASTFAKCAELGQTIIWLQTFGDRMADDEKGRPPGPPRLSLPRRPRISAAGAISDKSSDMPDSISYEIASKRLFIGNGYVENVEPAVWAYEVSGKQTLQQWFSYRRKNRERPIIGDRRPPSSLGNIQPDHWLAEYTTELLNVLNVLGWLVDLEVEQTLQFQTICNGPLISSDELLSFGVLEIAMMQKKQQNIAQHELFNEVPI